MHGIVQLIWHFRRNEKKSDVDTYKIVQIAAVEVNIGQKIETITRRAQLVAKKVHLKLISSSLEPCAKLNECGKSTTQQKSVKNIESKVATLKHQHSYQYQHQLQLQYRQQHASWEIVNGFSLCVWQIVSRRNMFKNPFMPEVCRIDRWIIIKSWINFGWSIFNAMQ